MSAVKENCDKVIKIKKKGGFFCMAAQNFSTEFPLTFHLIVL